MTDVGTRWPSAPYAPSSENNKAPILAVLGDLLVDHAKVLEIGSGTGQHAVHFAQALPHLLWQTSDVVGNHAGIEAWRRASGLANVLAALDLDVDRASWPVVDFDAAFSANTAHIMAWASVESMFHGIGAGLPAAGVFALYGPFNYAGSYTSAGNERFDRSLRAQDPGMGIRDVEAVTALAQAVGLAAEADHAMPANNRLLVWRKGASG